MMSITSFKKKNNKNLICSILVNEIYFQTGKYRLISSSPVVSFICGWYTVDINCTFYEKKIEMKMSQQ